MVRLLHQLPQVLPEVVPPVLGVHLELAARRRPAEKDPPELIVSRDQRKVLSVLRSQVIEEVPQREGAPGPREMRKAARADLESGHKTGGECCHGAGPE